MYLTYIDESSESADAVFAVGGFCGLKHEWKAIEPLWLASLPTGIDYFHATDCFGGRAQFKGMTIPERVKLLDNLTDLIVARELYLAVGVMDVPAYKQFSPKHLENESETPVLANCEDPALTSRFRRQTIFLTIITVVIR